MCKIYWDLLAEYGQKLNTVFRYVYYVCYCLKIRKSLCSYFDGMSPLYLQYRRSRSWVFLLDAAMCLQ